MPDEPIWKSAVRAVWTNRWARFLAFVFLAFEIYLNAILPAIERTVLLQKTIAETRASSGQSLPFPGSTPSPGSPRSGSIILRTMCETACRETPADIATAKATGTEITDFCRQICVTRSRH